MNWILAGLIFGFHLFFLLILKKWRTVDIGRFLLDPVQREIYLFRFILLQYLSKLYIDRRDLKYLHNFWPFFRILLKHGKCDFFNYLWITFGELLRRIIKNGLYDRLNIFKMFLTLIESPRKGFSRLHNSNRAQPSIQISLLWLYDEELQISGER